MNTNIINGAEVLKNKLYRTLKFDHLIGFSAKGLAIFGEGDMVEIYYNTDDLYHGSLGTSCNTLFDGYHKNGQISIYLPLVKDIERLLKERRTSMDEFKKLYICSVSLLDFMSFIYNEELTISISKSYASYEFTTLYEFFGTDGKRVCKINRPLPKELWPEVIGHVNPHRQTWSEHVVEFENVYRWPDGTISALVGDNMPKSCHAIEEARDLPKPEFWGLPESILRGYADSEVIYDNAEYSVDEDGLFKADIIGYRQYETNVEVTDGPDDGDSWGFGATRGSVTYNTTETVERPVFGEKIKISASDLPDGIGSKFRNLVEGYELVGYDYKKLIKLYKDREKEYSNACDERSRKQKELLQAWIDSQEWYKD